MPNCLIFNTATAHSWQIADGLATEKVPSHLQLWHSYTLKEKVLRFFFFFFKYSDSSLSDHSLGQRPLEIQQRPCEILPEGSIDGPSKIEEFVMSVISLEGPSKICLAPLRIHTLRAQTLSNKHLPRALQLSYVYSDLSYWSPQKSLHSPIINQMKKTCIKLLLSCHH